MARKINMFWSGATLGDINAACVRSFLRVGHEVTMHCYRAPGDLPRGAEVYDAARLMPERDLIRHSKSGSPALGANRYRYLLIEAGFGLYSDCDMYCLSEIDDEDYIIGQEETGTVNNAFLHYPPGSALSKFLLDATASRHEIPPGLSPARRRIAITRKRLGVPRSVETYKWGVWGPRLLTHGVNTFGLWDKTAPIDIYYPLHHRQTQMLFDPELTLGDIASSRTKAIHLWHRLRDVAPAPSGSPLHTILQAR